MMAPFPKALRSSRLPLLAVLLAMLGAFAAPAGAEYGGLGAVGALTAGVGGGHGEINPSAPHAFGVDPTDGSFYVGDFVESSKEFRVQKFGPHGEFLAENLLPKLASAIGIEGFAIDPVKKRLYMLVVYERESEPETEPVFDPGQPAAGAIYEFSTEVEAGKLKGQSLFVGPAVLKPQSLSEEPNGVEEAKVALLDPSGIAVDPQTHDLLILGQQDESTSKGEGQEQLRAAVQRVHTEGALARKLGPRYVDTGNCLDEGLVSGGEPACAEGEGRPFSPIVTPGGKVYAERQGGAGEIWEIPATAEAGTEFKYIATNPKRLFALGGGEQLVTFTSLAAEEEGGSMSFVPGASSGGKIHGKIYLDAEILEDTGPTKNLNRGGLILDYAEPEAGGAGEAKELGWTGGQNGTGGNEKCALPLGNPLVLVGADGEEHMLLFDATSHTISVLRFGSGGEGCGHATATPPKVSVGAAKGVTTVTLGKKATLSSEVSGANAESAEWKFKDKTTGREESAETTGYQFQTPTLEHKFKELGTYEITLVVEPDDFGPKIEEHAEVKVEASSVTVDFSHPGEAVTAGSTVSFTAKVKDPEEATPHVKYMWEFGDGAKKEGTNEGSEFTAEHSYAGEGHYEVKLTVIDAGERQAEKTYTIQVNAVGGNKEPKEETKKEEHKAEEPPKTEVPANKEVHNPEAKLAGTSLNVTPKGTLTLEVTCPSGETSCAGTATLRTLSAVSARSGHAAKRKKKAVVLILATGSFTVTGGQVKAVTLRLSAKALALLTRVHVLRAQATLLAHDPAGAVHTTQTVVTLRLAKASHRRKH